MSYVANPQCTTLAPLANKNQQGLRLPGPSMLGTKVTN